MARDLYRAMHIWSGGLRGGLAVQTMVVAVLMAAMTGIIGGEIILLGLVALPQMLRLNYDRSLAIGTICAGGSLGTMIPPSIVLIIYGLTAGVDIGHLFVATIVPGLLLATIYIGYIVVRCRLNPELGPPAPPEERNLPRAEKVRLIGGLVLPLGVAGGVLGSIYLGVASVSEAAGMGAVGAILSAAARRELSWPMLRDALYQTMNTCGMLLWITFGATALIGVYNVMGGDAFVKSLVTGLPLPPLGIIATMMALLIVLGLFMDWIGICLLTMPIFVPIVISLGYSPVWFGILFCMNMQISYLTPPFARRHSISRAWPRRGSSSTTSTRRCGRSSGSRPAAWRRWCSSRSRALAAGNAARLTRRDMGGETTTRATIFEDRQAVLKADIARRRRTSTASCGYRGESPPLSPAPRSSPMSPRRRSHSASAPAARIDDPSRSSYAVRLVRSLRHGRGGAEIESGRKLCTENSPRSQALSRPQGCSPRRPSRARISKEKPGFRRRSATCPSFGRFGAGQSVRRRLHPDGRRRRRP